MLAGTANSSFWLLDEKYIASFDCCFKGVRNIEDRSLRSSSQSTVIFGRLPRLFFFRQIKNSYSRSCLPRSSSPDSYVVISSLLGISYDWVENYENTRAKETSKRVRTQPFFCLYTILGILRLNQMGFSRAHESSSKDDLLAPICFLSWRRDARVKRSVKKLSWYRSAWEQGTHRVLPPTQAMLPDSSVMKIIPFWNVCLWPDRLYCSFAIFYQMCVWVLQIVVFFRANQSQIQPNIRFIHLCIQQQFKGLMKSVAVGGSKTAIQMPMQQIKLNKAAMEQHNRLQELEEQSQMLLSQIQRCKDSIKSRESSKTSQALQHERQRSRLTQLTIQNEGLEEQQDKLKNLLSSHLKSSQQKSKEFEDLRNAQERMKQEIQGLKQKISEQNKKEQEMRLVIAKKQTMYERSEKEITECELENKRLEDKIAQVCKEISEVQEILRKFRKQ